MTAYIDTNVFHDIFFNVKVSLYSSNNVSINTSTSQNVYGEGASALVMKNEQGRYASGWHEMTSNLYGMFGGYTRANY